MMKKLLVFDVDGTLVPFKEQGLYDAAQKFLTKLPKDNLPKIAFATNQGGPVCRDAGWETSANFPSLEMVYSRLCFIQGQVADIVGVTPLLLVSLLYRLKSGEYIAPKELPADCPSLREDWRKPNGGMLLEAMRYYHVSADETLMVGDSPDDSGAASAAGVDFCLPDEAWELLP